MLVVCVHCERTLHGNAGIWRNATVPHAMFSEVVFFFLFFFCGWVLARDMNSNYKGIALVAFLPSVWFGPQTRAEWRPEDRDKGIAQ